MKKIILNKTDMTISFIYPHCTNVVKCNTNHSWDLYQDGEELTEGPDFEIKESCLHMADITFSDFTAVPFRDYYIQHKDFYNKPTN